MSIESIKLINTRSGMNTFCKQFTNHNLTKVSLDAPTESVYVDGLPYAKAKFFPFTASIGTIVKETKKVTKNIIDDADYFSEFALHY